MKRMKTPALWLAAGLLAAAPAMAAVKPESAQYQVKYNGLSAKGLIRIQDAGKGRWSYNLRMSSLLASIDQATVFDMPGGRPRPLGSSRHFSSPIGAKSVTALFDWSRRQASWRGDVKPTRAGPVALAPGDIDPLLLNLALSMDAASGKPHAYRVAENGRVQPMRYVNLGTQQVSVGGKPRQAIRLFNQRGNKRTVVWILPGSSLPARIVQTEPGGDTIDLQRL